LIKVHRTYSLTLVIQPYVSYSLGYYLHKDIATKQGNYECVEVLIDNKVGINIANDHGNTPLHYACFFRYKDIALYLVENGALIGSKNKYGKTPLNFAGRLGDEIKAKAKDLGLKVEEVEVKLRETELIETEARAKHLAQSNRFEYLKKL
jgi:integrin-linked kinase